MTQALHNMHYISDKFVSKFSIFILFMKDFHTETASALDFFFLRWK